jgi:hypothetical protein
MRRLDWMLAAVIGVFLAGAFMAQAIDWGSFGFGGGGAAAGSRQSLVVRMMSLRLDSPISHPCPLTLRRPS